MKKTADFFAGAFDLFPTGFACFPSLLSLSLLTFIDN